MKRYFIGISAFLTVLMSGCGSVAGEVQGNLELANASHAMEVDSINFDEEHMPEFTNNNYEAIDTVVIPPLPAPVDVDYIYITNGSQSIEAKQLRVGDEFLGLYLCEIPWSSIIYIDDEFYEHWQTVARFSGELVLGGDLRITKDYQTGFETQIFSVHEDYLDILPWLANDSAETVGFDISNFDDLFKLLGLSEDDTAPMMSLVIPDLIIKIEELELVYMRTSIFSSARIVSLLES